MANATRRRTAKRAVQVARPVADAVELVEDQEEDVEPTNYALRLTAALEAISAAQVAEPVEATYAPVRHAARPAPKAQRRAKLAPEPAPVAAEVDEEERIAQPKGIGAFVAALDKLPPIRLPIGPAIPWRIGLPVLLTVLTVMVVVGRPQSQPEPIGTRLPAQEKYSVQQDAPLFAKPAESAPIGVTEPAATAGVDLLDVGVKFAAVLALAYGSLVLLKRVGLGGGAPKNGQAMAGVRVVSSMALAPNRTVHVIRTPGGKSLLVGATPSQVNLIADLGEVDEDALVADSGNFFDVLSSKLAR